MTNHSKSVCEEENFRLLFMEHAELIRNFLFYKCNDMEQAEDLTQEAFVKLWNNCKKVAFEKAKSFVMKVAQNAFYNQVKHQKIVLRYRESSNPTDVSFESPEFQMEEKEFKTRLLHAIDDLPDKQREVFLLSRIEKKTYSEIADIVGISVKGVERRMHLALVELKKKIGRPL